MSQTFVNEITTAVVDELRSRGVGTLMDLSEVLKEVHSRAGGRSISRPRITYWALQTLKDYMRNGYLRAADEEFGTFTVLR
jgi:hypothetical protein